MNDTPEPGGGATAEPVPPVPLEALDRTLAPPPEVEERTVAALRSEGLLRPGLPSGRDVDLPHRRSWSRPLAGGWLAAAAAGALALFAGGYAAGQAAGSRATLEALTALEASDPGERAAALQRTGSLYVRAVTSLAGSDPTAPGHEVALATLRAATAELARLAPDDARLARILSILGGSEVEAAEGSSRTLLWF